MLKNRLLAVMKSPIWLVAVAAGGLVVGVGLRDRDIFVVAFGSALLALCAVGVFSHDHEILKSPRPIVRVWERDGVTAVGAEADWQLFWSLRERLASAYPDYNAVVGVADLAYFLRGRRPIVLLTAFFTDDENQQELLGRFLTGGMNDYMALARGCRVERTEMFLPTHLFPAYRDINEQGFVPLTLAAAYRLIHGPEAKPPVPTEAPEPFAPTNA